MSPNSDVFKAVEPPERALGYIQEQYGISPTTFDGMQWYSRNGRTDLWLLANPSLDVFPASVHTVGIKVFDRDPPSGHPSNTFLRRFGHLATAGRIDLDKDDAERFARGENIPHEPKQLGYVIVMHDGMFLGRGFARETGTLDAQVSRQFRLLEGDELVSASSDA